MAGKQQGKHIGIIGLGAMGWNLLLNFVEHGFSVSGYDKNKHQIEKLSATAHQHNIELATDIPTFVGSLALPRTILLLVPAGTAVDDAIVELLPYLQAGDLIIDAGNSYFKDTAQRARYLTDKNIQFLGMGISGGTEGAHHGASIMLGGSKEAYDRIYPLLKSLASEVDGKPSIEYFGSGSAGHYVKMIHNGIEYGLMQLISETYDLLKRGLQIPDKQIHLIYREWNQGELNCYLLEASSDIVAKIDEKTGNVLLNQIVDAAKQKGTGLWTLQSAQELQVPVPTIDLAVMMRDMSILTKQRTQASLIYNWPAERFIDDHASFILQLRHALFAGMIITFAQGMALLQVASDKYEYQFKIENIANVWRGNCIIRAALLDDIRAAFHTNPNLENLLFDPMLAKHLITNQADLRQIVRQATELGIPVPSLMASLSYLDAYRSRSLPTNLIQAQRDYFGSHTYERIDCEGIFHTKWK